MVLEIEALRNKTNRINLNDMAPLPWDRINSLQDTTDQLQVVVQQTLWYFFTRSIRPVLFNQGAPQLPLGCMTYWYENVPISHAPTFFWRCGVKMWCTNVFLEDTLILEEKEGNQRWNWSEDFFFFFFFFREHLDFGRKIGKLEVKLKWRPFF